MTALFCWGIIAIIIIFDVWVIVKGGSQVSVSYYMADLFKDSPMVTFSFGVVCGHWLWPIPPKKCRDESK